MVIMAIHWQHCAIFSLIMIKSVIYHHLPGLCSKTIVYSKISKKLWVPGMVASRLHSFLTSKFPKAVDYVIIQASKLEGPIVASDASISAILWVSVLIFAVLFSNSFLKIV